MVVMIRKTPPIFSYPASGVASLVGAAV